MKRIPIGGWRKCVHEAAAFESRGEYATATILDNASVVDWWFRNDPPLFRISTPAGFLEPDFFYRAKRDDHLVNGLLEVKGEIFWDGEGSLPRLKSAAAVRWVEAANSLPDGPRWEFALVIDDDAVSAGSLEEIRKVALEIAP